MSARVADPQFAGEAPRTRSRLIDAFVVASDDSFALEVGPLLGARFRVRPVERLADIDSIGSTRWLGLLDGSAANAHGLLNEIEQHHARAPLIAVVADGQQGKWTSALARGSIIAVIPRGNLAGPALQHALTDAERRLGLSTVAAGPAATPAAPAPPLGRSLLWYYLAAAAVLAAGAGWFVMRGKDTAPVTGVAPPVANAPAPGRAPGAIANVNNGTPAGDAAVADAVVPRRPVLELLSLARIAFRDPTRQMPRDSNSKRGDSAIELYAEVLEQDPANAEARDGVRRLFAVARSRVQSDLNAGRIDEAQRMLALFTTAGVAADSTKALQADIKAAEPKWFAAQLRRALGSGDLTAAEQYYTQLAASGADRNALQDARKLLDTRAADAQLVAMGADVRAAIEAGALLEPASGNARSRLLAMRQVNRNHAATNAAQKSLQEALLARAREALQAQQPDGAQRWLTAAAEFGNSADLTELRRRLQEQTEQATARAAAAAVATPVAIVPAKASVAPPYVTARPTQPLSVTYPLRASNTGTSGYVIVEFTLGVNGKASNITVIEAQPAGMFDKSATDAVARGRFDTSVLPVDRQPTRARLRVTFKPS